MAVVLSFFRRITFSNGMSKMEEEKLIVIPIHCRKELMNDCCDLINSEWPRSKTARMRSLEASREEFPTSLVLVTSNNKLVGHCKISAVPNIPESCFVESVVIHKNHRGRGWGMFLMKKVENYVVSYGKSTIYLSTKGQEMFYSKLGYSECKPLSIYGQYQPSFIKSDPALSVKNVPMSFIIQAPPPPPLPSFNHSCPSRVFMKKELKCS